MASPCRQLHYVFNIGTRSRSSAPSCSGDVVLSSLRQKKLPAESSLEQTGTGNRQVALAEPKPVPCSRWLQRSPEKSEIGSGAAALSIAGACRLSPVRAQRLRGVRKPTAASVFASSTDPVLGVAGMMWCACGRVGVLAGEPLTMFTRGAAGHSTRSWRSSSLCPSSSNVEDLATATNA